MITVAATASGPGYGSMRAATAISRRLRERRCAMGITVMPTWAHSARATAEYRPASRLTRNGSSGPWTRRALTKDASVFARLPISGDVCSYLASADYDPRDVRSLSKAELEGRVQAYAYLEILRTMPGCERAYLVSTGPQFGTRESRHINAVEQLKWQDVRAGRGRSDTVALGAGGVEWHDRETFKSTFEAPPGGAAYSIPLDCLRSRDTANLFAAGRTADGDQQAGASLRVMGTSFATGQAAGVAAALLANDGAVDVRKVQSALRNQDAVLDPRDMLEVRGT